MLTTSAIHGLPDLVDDSTIHASVVSLTWLTRARSMLLAIPERIFLQFPMDCVGFGPCCEGRERERGREGERERERDRERERER
jgi:hypothetical protein